MVETRHSESLYFYADEPDVRFSRRPRRRRRRGSRAPPLSGSCRGVRGKALKRTHPLNLTGRVEDVAVKRARSVTVDGRTAGVGGEVGCFLAPRLGRSGLGGPCRARTNGRTNCGCGRVRPPPPPRGRG